MENTMIWVRNKAGKQLALLNGYTFYCEKTYKNTESWKCTTNAHCRSRAVLSKSGQVVRGDLTHTHPPNKFIILNGIYIKL